MASGITTAQQLQDVLDTIHNSISQMDVYQGLSELGSLRLCWNDISRTATIFKRINEDENREEVVCTFKPENIVIGTDTFQGKMLENIVHNTTTTVTRSNDIGLGGYVGIKTLIRNICAALGVNLAPNFDEINPTIYGELVNIVKKYYGDSLQNNAPYGLARKDTTSGDTTTTTYNSYIPIMIIVDIAIYLNSLGIFVVGGDKMYNAGITQLFGFAMSSKMLSSDFNSLISNTNIRDYIPSVGDVYGLYDKSFIFSNADFIRNNGNTNWKNFFDALLPAVKSEYYSELDSSQVLILTQYGNKFYIYQFPSTCTYTSYIGSPDNYLEINNVKEDYIITIYIATQNNTTHEITFNKSVIEKLRYDSYGSSNDTPLLSYEYTVSNIKFNNFKLYSGEKFRSSDSSTKYYYYVDYYPELQNNTKYDNIKFLNYKYFIKYAGKAGSSSTPTEYMIIQKNNNLFSENDFIVIVKDQDVNTNWIYRFYVFKNVHHLSSDIINSLCISSMSDVYFAYNKELVSGTLKDRSLSYSVYKPVRSPSLIDHYFNFYENVNYSIYECSQRTKDFVLTQTASGTTDKYTFTIGTERVTNHCAFYNFNIGEAVLVEDDLNLAGIKLQDNATYPSEVIDYKSFKTTYPDWVSGNIGYSQPYFEEDKIAGTYTAQWAAISVDTDTPTSQADSQAGEIDFTDTDLVDVIIDNIDNADDGNDKEEVDPNSDEIEGEGETPDDELDRIEPNVLTGGFVKQYALTAAQMQELATCLTNPDLLQTAIRAFRDPMKAIVSLQLAYKTPTLTNPTDIILYGFDWSSLTNKPKGYPLATNIINFDFGTVHIEPLYKTYQDITTTSIELYLPCVGFIPLNPAEFLDRGLDVEGKIDTLSGTIVYDISAYDGKKRKLLYQKTGNCQLQLPISSNDNSTIFGALMGVGGMALGGFTGNPLLMAQGAATTGASMTQGPNYEHGGSISANAGLMTKMIPCVIIKRNQVYNPTHLNELHGLPANSYVKLGSCSGYTVVQDVKVDIQGATQSEKSQIETLLKGGVIL